MPKNIAKIFFGMKRCIFILSALLIVLSLNSCDKHGDPILGVPPSFIIEVEDINADELTKVALEVLTPKFEQGDHFFVANDNGLVASYYYKEQGNSLEPDDSSVDWNEFLKTKQFHVYFDNGNDLSFENGLYSFNLCSSFSLPYNIIFTPDTLGKAMFIGDSREGSNIIHLSNAFAILKIEVPELINGERVAMAISLNRGKFAESMDFTIGASFSQSADNGVAISDPVETNMLGVYSLEKSDGGCYNGTMYLPVIPQECPDGITIGYFSGNNLYGGLNTKITSFERNKIYDAGSLADYTDVLE